MSRPAAVGVTLLLLALAACAAPLEPAPETPLPTPVSTPTPTPTPVVLEVPLARIPADCGTLVSADELAVVDAGWTLVRDGSDAPRTALAAARRQAATTDCRWETPGGGFFAFLIVPEAGREYTTHWFERFLEQGAIFDPLGENSVFYCSDTGCDFSVLVADVYWLAGRFELPGLSADATLRALLPRTMGRISETVLNENPPWRNPPAVHPGWGRTCGSLVGGLATLLDRPGLVETPPRFGAPDRAVVDRVDPAFCGLTDAEGAMLLALAPGGAWAVQELGDDPGDFEVVEVDGLGPVLLSGTPTEFTALTVLQGSLVQVTISATTREDFLRALPGILDLVRRTPYTPPAEED